MKREAPKLRVIEGGKKDRKIKLGMEFILFSGIIFLYLSIIIWSIYEHKI